MTLEPTIHLIAALSENRALGKGGELIYRISDDLKRFKKLTLGYPVIMGRKTFESIGRALPQRTNILISRDASYKAPGCIVVHSFKEALEKAREETPEKLFIIGGGDIFAQALPFADVLHLTLVHEEAAGDVFFPDYSEFSKVLHREDREAHGLRYTFLDLARD